jgi:hypothetical protein
MDGEMGCLCAVGGVSLVAGGVFDSGLLQLMNASVRRRSVVYRMMSFRFEFGDDVNMHFCGERLSIVCEFVKNTPLKLVFNASVFGACAVTFRGRGDK